MLHSVWWIWWMTVTGHCCLLDIVHSCNIPLNILRLSIYTQKCGVSLHSEASIPSDWIQATICQSFSQTSSKIKTTFGQLTMAICAIWLESVKGTLISWHFYLSCCLIRSVFLFKCVYLSSHFLEDSHLQTEWSDYPVTN